MNKEQRLEDILRATGKVDVPKPNGVGARTLQHLTTSQPPRSKVQRFKAARNIGVTIAACLLLMVGYFAALNTLDWWSSPSENDVDLPTDPRIIEAQKQLPFSLTLPTWLPEGYSLKDVKLFSDSSDLGITLSFTGPKGSEPITITQAYTMEMQIISSLADLQFVQLDSPQRDCWLDSTDYGWGAGTRADLGYYYESPETNINQERVLIFIADPIKEPHSYVTIYSGTSIAISRLPEKLPTKTEFIKIAQDMTGAEVKLFTPEEEDLKRIWPLARPTYLPSGFEPAAIQLRASLKGTPRYFGISTYAKTDTDMIHIRQLEQAAAPGGEELMLGTISGYYAEEGAGRKLSLSVGGELTYNFEVFSDSGEVDKANLVRIAQSIINQFDYFPTPTAELYSLQALPTTGNLIFGPREDVFVGYIPANCEVAQLWMGDTMHDLPSDLTLGDFGPVSWRGERFVYHTVSAWEAGPGIFYIYDIRDHSWVSFPAPESWDGEVRKPIFFNDNTIIVPAPGGLWTYSTTDKKWKLQRAIDDYSGLEEVSLSPDASKAAWITGGGSRQLKIMDVVGSETLFSYNMATYGVGPFELAWSSDSSKLAVAGSAILIWDGTEQVRLVNNSHVQRLSWVPGRDILSYQIEMGLILVKRADNTWAKFNYLPQSHHHFDKRNYAWLPNGNLAIVDDQGEETVEITIYGWK